MVIVDCAHYEHGKRVHEGKLDLEDAAERARRKDGMVWLGLFEPDTEMLRETGKAFGLHELAMEDAHKAHQRPKIEEYDESWFLVLRTARYHDETEVVQFGEVHVFVGENYVVTVRHGEPGALAGSRERLEKRPELLRDHGPAAAVWAILDAVVDQYMPVADGLDNDVAEVEEQVFTGNENPTDRIYFLKREVLGFYRAVQPLITPLELLEEGEMPGVDGEIQRYFRDVADHARRVDELVATGRELLDDVLQANVSKLSLRQNTVVQKISGWAAIIAVPTLISGVYGMNFEHMPELKTEIGYPITLVVMISLAFGLWRYLRRIDWM